MAAGLVAGKFLDLFFFLDRGSALDTVAVHLRAPNTVRAFQRQLSQVLNRVDYYSLAQQEHREYCLIREAIRIGRLGEK